jgi:hypothetical protein
MDRAACRQGDAKGQAVMIDRPSPAFVVVAALVLGQQIASGHVGSPDVFLDAQAGPYRLLVTVRPPYAVPGVADVEVLTTSPDIDDVRIVPLPLTGPGARFAPTADIATRSPRDQRLFTGQLWMMSAGAWQVRVTATGKLGEGTLAVPVPTLPQATLAMSRGLRALLVAFMLVLCAGFVSIVSAIAREASLEAGEKPGGRARRRGWVAAVAATCLVVGVIAFGNRWWTAEATTYARYVYKPLEASSTITPDQRLRLELRDPGWLASRRLDDFVPDHGHLMHLFVLSPSLDRLWHLHPDEVTTGVFEVHLPEMPQGEYDLFADLVHRTGVSETVTGRLRTSGVRGVPLTGDDSGWPITSGGTSDAGGRIVWVRDDQPLRSRTLTVFTFRVEDGAGRPATDLELYMGMPGHAVFVRRDRRVFAHVHPSGSAPMAAIELAMPDSQLHTHPGAGLPPTVSFPYGFPEPGDYRIFVQVRRGGRIVTGVFDADVN